MASVQSDDASAWVEELLRESAAGPPARSSADFAERCQDAALAALTARKLRPVVARVGFIAIPFAAYLAHLCRLGGVALDRLAEQAAAPDAGRLAAWIGLPADQFAVLFRLGLLGEAGQPVKALAKARGDMRAEDALAWAEGEVGEMMNGLTPHDRGMCERSTREALQAYRHYAAGLSS